MIKKMDSIGDAACIMIQLQLMDDFSDMDRWRFRNYLIDASTIAVFGRIYETSDEKDEATLKRLRKPYPEYVDTIHAGYVYVWLP